jgi:hypothetical protein
MPGNNLDIRVAEKKSRKTVYERSPTRHIQVMSEKIMDRAAAIKAEALKLDVSNTKVVKMSDLKVGDVVLHVGPEDTGTTFPFPFTLSKVEHLAKYKVVMLQATHGWFNMRPYPANDTAVVVAS